MRVAQSIEQKLAAAFAPVELQVTDDSDSHAGHAGAQPGGQTHFSVRIVSRSFDGVSRVERQRRVYALLSDEFSGSLHALSLKALTPDEVGRG